MKKQIILLLLAISISSCSEKKYEWSASISVPSEYPVAIQRGLIGKSFFGPSCINSSWGEGIEVAKKQGFTAPDTFEITWLSMTERKFYKGKWNLPKNKIKQYLENGFIKKNKKIDCNKIQIGLAPKGLVIVWLSGNQGIQIEIGRYQATQVNLNSVDVYGSSKFMFEKNFIEEKLNDSKFVNQEVRENIKKYGYPSASLYDVFREKYIWKPQILLPDGCKMSEITLKMCNGENEIGNTILDTNQKSIPYFFKIIWKNKKGQEFISRIVFIKDREYWQRYLVYEKEKLPLNFDRTLIFTQFKEKIQKKQSVIIAVKIIKDSVSDIYLEQDSYKYPINEFSQETKKILKNKPCICK
ncbi:DUF2931 family protein [Flavobacterium daemonense]|uniref:DUF2931 family protein n=1 Tax=Flavobacterium daemonense TaxID=1393049 RepID=UPI0011852035|nr:DUF2931 family protein [Flavobacterium daemonense]KAF2336833.1 DUF2931 family protein [Flavobacterium daemonense]